MARSLDDEPAAGMAEEEILEPQLPIIDPHHHLWRRDGWSYLLDDLVADLESGHNVAATVFVECGADYRESGPEYFKPVGETEFVAGIAEEAEARGIPVNICAGIVGTADLTLGAGVDAVLEAQMAAGRGRFRGIRHRLAADSHPAFRMGSETATPLHLAVEPAFRKGFARLAAYELSFEAWLYHPQLPELTDLARAFPDVPVILNHLGGPLGTGPYAGKGQEIFAQWRQDIATLAACPNITVKLGGIAMPINGYGWHERAAPPSSVEMAAATRDWHLYAIDAFGPDRCMFESNFPVDKVSCSYATLWNCFKRIAAEFSEVEKADLFYRTARRVYRL